MALSYELNGSILHVTEVILSGFNTRKPDKVRHWYYDIESWRCSSHGKEGDAIDRPMDQGGIDWVRKYYLPKVGLTA